MGNNIRGNHSRPGIYTRFTDLTIATKSLGITTAGLVGETLKGPAFEPISVKDFSEYQSIFGGKSPELYKDSLYPRYELPYIAESYLKKSDQLSVCRVLGLSGYNAGPAFIITASGDGPEKYVVAILRSRGSYRKYANIGTDCNPINKYDTLLFDCDEVELDTYTDWSMVINGCERGTSTDETEDIMLSNDNYGQFTVICKKNGVEVGRYPVSFNAGSKEYIYNVLGSKPTEGNAAVFVEELYDLRLINLIADGTVTILDKEVTKVGEVKYNVINEPAVDFVNIPCDRLKSSMINKPYLCDVAGVMTDTSNTESAEENGYVYMRKETGGTYVETEMKVGGLYTVAYFRDSNGVKELKYFAILDEEGNEKTIGVMSTGETTIDTVKVLTTNEFYYLSLKNVNGAIAGTTETIRCVKPVVSLSDYHERFRCASTPWVVSEIKGDSKKAEVKKLFRFHTITDGNYANEQVKVTISNIRPDEGRFDVLIRDYNDSDSNMTILESYRNVSMVPGDSKYIALQIGTIDGAYEINSKYVMLEIIENDMTETCIPCGFLGYPVRDYEPYGEYGLVAPTFVYNKLYDPNIKAKRQCFGLTDITGIDVDMLLYKGKIAYSEDYTKGYTHPFHLDSTLNSEVREELGIEVTIDGDESTKGIEWEAVALNQGNEYTKAPIIGTEEAMIGSLYEDKNTRKFTVCFYGGFDGWDIYRNSRTTGDDFKANRYKGTILNGYGETFSKIDDGTGLNLKGNCITSDYYAFLAGAMQYQNPERYVINLFATPGIDYVNNTMLFNEILEMTEERQDTLYIPTTPDKPYGATDDVSEMYTADEAVENLEDTSIDTYYAATYYPWVKYYDKDNKMYINLPPTKDALRDMADVDNKSYPWMAPAGVNRGDVEGKRLHKYTLIDDEDTLYDGRINALTTFSKEGIKIWGNKTMYSVDSPMNRVNVVRLMLYMRKLIIEASRTLIFDQNDATLKTQFEKIINGIMTQIKKDRGITDYKFKVSQTLEEMDAHELNSKLLVKPIPTMEYISIDFVVTPQGVNFADL